MRRVVLFVLLMLLLASPVHAVREGEFGFAPQAGYNIFFGRLNELVGPDVGYGADFIYGIADWVAIDFDLFYSEHQQADSEKVGTVQFNHIQTSIGPRFTWHTRLFAPYLAVSFGGNFYKWENSFSGRTDEFDGNGPAGYLVVGVDAYVANGVTIGLAAKGGIASSDFEFETQADGTEKIDAYAHFSPLFRLTIIF
jgi:Outer membrane protein beta-barrel domain